MANLINATVYQIDGNPQKVATVVAFDTDKIRLQETTLSTIPAVVSFIEVQGEKLNAPVVKYFVSESVATLVAAANTGSTTLLQATIVAINENPFKVAKQMAFPANKVTVWSFTNGTINSFLQFNEDKFYATESKTSLVAAANIGGGSSYKVYTALLTQQGGNDSEGIGSGDLLNIGGTYYINGTDNDTVDFTNVGAPNNNVGTYFVATGTTPNSWGETNSGGLVYNFGAPTVTVLDNTIGDIWFIYNEVGTYSINSNELFTENKTALVFGGVNYNTIIDTTTGYGPNAVYNNYPNNLRIESIKTQGDQRIDDALNNTFIEIRVYN